MECASPLALWDVGGGLSKPLDKPGFVRSLDARVVQPATLEDPMRHPAPDYPLFSAREAIQSLTGASLAMGVTCTLGGIVPTVASFTSYPLTEELFLLGVAWVWHWVLAGVMIWGLFGMLVPVWCMYQLLHGTRRPFSVLALALVTQLFVSTIAVCTVSYESERMRSILASLAVALVVGIGCAISAFRASREEEKHQAEADARLGEWVPSEVPRLSRGRTR